MAHSDRIRVTVLPKSQYEISTSRTGTPKPKETNRANIRSRKSDTMGDYTVGLYQIDDAIKYYFDNVIKPTVIEDEELIKVPVLYGYPERWKSMQRDGYYRDPKGKAILPLIMYRRTSISKNENIPTSALDANNPNLYYTFQKKYNKMNKYDKFSVLQGISPSEEFYKIIMPKYVTLTYETIIFTEYLEQMNKLVEAIQYSEGAYWGDEERFKFRCNIESFDNATELEAAGDRLIKTTFNMTFLGYIIPDSINKELSLEDPNPVSSYSPSSVFVAAEVDNVSSQFAVAPQAEGAGSATPGGIPSVSVSSEAVFGTFTPIYDYLQAANEITGSVVNSDNVIFESCSLIDPPSDLRAQNTSDFMVFINGQRAGDDVITSITDGLVSGNERVTVNLNTTKLNYTLDSDDEVTLWGKVTGSGIPRT